MIGRQVFTIVSRLLHVGLKPAHRTKALKTHRLPAEIANDKGRYHSLKSTERERIRSSRWHALITTFTTRGARMFDTSPNPTSDGGDERSAAN
jgi:hypothetical protein